MAKISYMRRLTLGVIMALITFAVVLPFASAIVTAANGTATYYAVTTREYMKAYNITMPSMPPPFAQPYFELLIASGSALIPIAIVIWDSNNAKEEEIPKA